MADMKQINISIPEELHDKISFYNMISSRPVNMTRVCQIALEKELKIIGDEIIEALCNDETLTDLNTGERQNDHSLSFEKFKIVKNYIETNPDKIYDSELAYAIFELTIALDMGLDSVEEMKDKQRKNMKQIKSQIKSHNVFNPLAGCMSLYPVNRFEFDGNKITFYKDNIELCSYSGEPEHYPNPFI